MKSSVLLREQRFVTLSTASKVLLPANPRRRGAIISAPAYSISGQASNNNTVAAADTTTLGAKLTTAGAASKQTKLTSASATLTAGATPTMALNLVDPTGTYELARGTLPLYWSGEVVFGFATSVEWRVVTAGAGSTANLFLGATNSAAPDRITLSFVGAAVQDQGVTLPFGSPPLILWPGAFGFALVEEVAVISSIANLTIGVLDIFEP